MPPDGNLVVVTIVLLTLSPAYAALEFEYFRAIYDGDWNYSRLEDLGFDCIYEPVTWRSEVSELVPVIREQSQDAANHNLIYMVGPRFRPRKGDCNFTRAVNKHGQVQESPSPLDEGYWRKAIEESGRMIANMSLYYPISGIVWDMEVYYMHWLWNEWTYYSYTYDRMAIEAFANATDVDIPSMPASERHDWLQVNGLLEEFKEWQEDEVFSMARGVEEKIHAINPQLHLGTLGFQDKCWWFLSILKGFCSEDLSVSAWHEDTYGGWGTQEINDNHDVFAEWGIEGKVITGLWVYRIPPFRLLIDMERAARYSYSATVNGSFWTTYNGSLWIYPRHRNPWHLADESQYIKALELLETKVFFNRSSPNPLPPFTVYPWVEIKPHLGPNGVISAIVNSKFNSSAYHLPPHLGLAFSDLELPPYIEEITYVDKDMETKTVSRPVIPLEDLPCILWGMNLTDLNATWAWSAIHELGVLVDTFQSLDMGDIGEISRCRENAIEDFEAGRYLKSGQDARDALDDGYDLVMNEVRPFVEEGFANPRNSSVPLVILNKIYSADRIMERGEEMKGRSTLLMALKDWSEIGESVPLLSGFLACIIFLGALVPGSKEKAGGNYDQS